MKEKRDITLKVTESEEELIKAIRKNNPSPRGGAKK